MISIDIITQNNVNVNPLTLIGNIHWLGDFIKIEVIDIDLDYKQLERYMEV